MKARILTALVLIPPVVYLIGWSPQWLFLLALLVVLERSFYEYFLIARRAGFQCLPAVGYVAGGALCLAQVAELRRPGVLFSAFLALAVLLTLSLATIKTTDLKQYLGAASSTLFGILYLGLTLPWLVPLRFSETFSPRATGRQLMLFLFLVIWADDIFAYVAGRAVGRTPLFPRVSPKKTVEGAVGGILGSLLVGRAFSHWFWQTADLKTVILLSGVVAVAGQIGDLAESAMKRGADLKDSGDILPGHGGLLDRIDSLIFGVPALWLVLTLRDFFK